MRKGFKYLSPVLLTGLIVFSAAFAVRQSGLINHLNVRHNAVPANYSIYKDMIGFLIPVIKN